MAYHAISSMLMGIVIASLLSVQACGKNGSTERIATPLELAVYENMPERVTVLLKEGVPENFRAGIGPQLLQYAMSDELIRNHREEPKEQVIKRADDIVRILLNVDVDPNGRTSYGVPILHEAIANDRLAAAEQLLERGADVNSIGDNWSALMLAVYHCHVDIVALLLKRGAVLTWKNHSGETLESMAQQSCPSALSLLQTQGRVPLGSIPKG